MIVTLVRTAVELIRPITAVVDPVTERPPWTSRNTAAVTAEELTFSTWTQRRDGS